MAHKRYIVKGGKLYGPYLYESYRSEDGSVRKRYLGRHKDIKRGNILSGSFIFLLMILAIFSIGMLFRIFLQKFF